jgi:Putative prokaryotic signal transducing protein
MGPVRLTIAPNEPAAELIRSLLETEGIDSMVRQTDYGAGTMDGFRGGQQEILVDPKDLERGRELISGDTG